MLDTIRPYFWNNKNIITCYKQDMFLYIKEERYEEVRANFGNTAHIYDIVHPDGFLEGCSVNKLINRRFLMKHLPENIFLFMKKVYLIFGRDKVV